MKFYDVIKDVIKCCRITGMVEKLAKFYGTEICKIDGQTFYSFPDVVSLSDPSVEETLKQNGFGYRAKYIFQSARHIMESGGIEWIKDLKEMKYLDAKKTLMILTGVGAKVNTIINIAAILMSSVYSNRI